MVDPSRINIFERWEPQAVLDTYRRSAPAPEQQVAMLSVAVSECDVADVLALFGNDVKG